LIAHSARRIGSSRPRDPIDIAGGKPIGVDKTDITTAAGDEEALEMYPGAACAVPTNTMIRSHQRRLPIGNGFTVPGQEVREHRGVDHYVSASNP